jgi:hypothetical protein
VVEFEFEREDWTAFRTLDGLCRKAGTPRGDLARVVVKELVDNALDAAGDCELTLSDGVVTIVDRGAGIPGDDAAIARLFSINRPMASSKYWRLPTRGALGNGLRVVVGAVIATGGKLLVGTRGRKLEIIPDPLTGQSRAVRVGGFKGPGTRIELVLGDPLEPVPEDLVSGEVAIVAARCQERRYGGRSSPHWFDPDAFHELLLSVPDEGVTAREVISQFEGCSASAGDITDGFAGRPARGLGRDEARELLARARAATRPVNPERLGAVGKAAFSGAYTKKTCRIAFPAGPDGMAIEVPAVVEAWADPDSTGSSATIMVNGTPCVADADAWYKPKEKMTIVYGPGLHLELKTGRKGVLLHVNVITPYMPMTSDGKAPDLGRFERFLEEVIERAVKRARRTDAAIDPGRNLNIKSVVFAHMEEQIKIVSDTRRYRFGWRQVFYRIRPIVWKAIGEQLHWDYFSQDLVTAYEEENGEEPKAYRDPRGTFYVPHGGRSFPLGTLQVEEFRRPEWRFNKVLFVEKEGFFEALKAEGWPERHDCALMTSKGQPTRAARDIIDLIGETDEPVWVGCLHDADAAGTMIFQSLQEETDARPRRNVEIANLGLEPWEAVALAERGLVEIEDVSYEKRQPTAAYVGDEWAEWLQAHRVELNAFTTAEFIEWLDGKMSEYEGKLIPPPEVLADQIEAIARSQIEGRITAEVLRAADIKGRVEREYAERADAIAAAKASAPARVRASLDRDDTQPWTAAVDRIARKAIARQIGGRRG